MNWEALDRRPARPRLKQNAIAGACVSGVAHARSSDSAVIARNGESAKIRLRGNTALW